MKVLILRGIPGAGKSTFQKALPGRVLVCSADHYFERSGSYQFNPAELPKAHGECLKKFVEGIQRGLADTIVVDNTSTTVAEVAPYAALALAYGCELEVVTVECAPDVGAARNTHGVSLAACTAMAGRLAESAKQLPPWWAHKVIPAG